MQKKDFLHTPVKHIDIKTFNATPIVEAMSRMSFTSRDLAQATEIYRKMLVEPDCAIFLTIAGSTSAAGCNQIYIDLVRHHLVDAIIATGATVVDMDFLEALGFRHWQGRADADDTVLRNLYIDRIYDTYIDEEELQSCDRTIKEIADALPPRSYTSREFIREMGRFLAGRPCGKDSLCLAAFEEEVPIFCPAFSDSSAGFGLVMHQARRPDNHLTIDSVRDFHEATKIKIAAPTSGLVVIGGGAPKNFAQDTVICAELLGHDVPMHKYALQITVADVRDGACSSSTFKEANSWGKVDSVNEQMVYAEATSVLPLMASTLYHSGVWKTRTPRRFARLFDPAP